MSDVRGFGASGDGKTDDTAAIQHAADDGDGILGFSPGVYRITKPIRLKLKGGPPRGIDGSLACARVVMHGPGPAFLIEGTHEGRGHPSSVNPRIWAHERMPTIRNIEIEGAHAEADGIQLIETMQCLLDGVLIRRVRHGIHLRKRNRNVLLANSHIYHNRGVGVFLDRVNLHQICISGSHISYNRLGGIRVEGSEVRNLQITANDIEYNNDREHGEGVLETAEIHIDTTAPKASVNEVTIASNTIQATVSAKGANIRIRERGGEGRPPGLYSITGNVIGNQENCVHLIGCHGVVLSGNCIYSSGERNVLVEDSDQINLSGNALRQHNPGLATGVRFVNSRNCVINGTTIQDEAAPGKSAQHSLLELVGCDGITVSNCQLLDGAPYGLDVDSSSRVNVVGCTISEGNRGEEGRAALRFRGKGRSNLLSGNLLGEMEIAAESGVNSQGNLPVSAS